MVQVELCCSAGIFLRLHMWSEIKGGHCFLLSKSDGFVSFSLFQHKPRVSAPHLELALCCISCEVLRPQKRCNIKLIPSALGPSLCSHTLVCFQNHRCWNDVKALYWPPAQPGLLLFDFFHKPSHNVLSSKVIDRFSGINYRGLQGLGILHSLTAVWLMLALSSSSGPCWVVTLGERMLSLAKM